MSSSFPPLVGVDFSSRPTRRKPITVAHGERAGAVLRLQRVDAIASIEAFAEWLQQPGPWLGAFDFPFSLPRELVEHLGWPTEWPALMRHYAALSREEIRSTFAAFCAARPVGSKFAHRACDEPAGSSPSMKWVNPPVAYMLHAGVPPLIDAGVSLPAVGHAGDPQRVALEGYPGLLARELAGRRSYKSDEAAKQTADRLIARKDIVDALEPAAEAQPCAARGAGRRCQRRPARCGAVPDAGRLGRGPARPRPAGRVRPARGLDRQRVKRAAEAANWPGVMPKAARKRLVRWLWST